VRRIRPATKGEPYDRGVFEGAFSIWHIAIVLVVLFVVVGPKRISRMGKSLGDTVTHFVEEHDGEGDGGTGKPSEAGAGASSQPKAAGAVEATRVARRRTLGYRMGRLVSRVRRLRRRR
jgi:TatA/E family protein of Tat protein translocase